MSKEQGENNWQGCVICGKAAHDPDCPALSRSEGDAEIINALTKRVKQLEDENKRLRNDVIEECAQAIQPKGLLPRNEGAFLIAVQEDIRYLKVKPFPTRRTK